jgi:type II secretion system protein H
MEPVAPRAGACGFTLVEIMIVTGIVALFASLLVLSSTPDGARRAQGEARRLAALLELAIAEARAGGQAIAWQPQRAGYVFWYRTRSGEWVRYPDDSVFRPRIFGGDTELRGVTLDGRTVPEGDRIDLPTYGFSGALEATIAGGNATILLRGDVLGRILLQRRGEAADGGAQASQPRLHAG